MPTLRSIRNVGMSLVGPLCVAACSAADPTPAAPGSCQGTELLVAASDYQGSSLVCGAPTCVESAETTGADLGVDPQLTASGGRAFFLARDKDLLFELDPACGTPRSKVSIHAFGPESTGGGGRRLANAHDVAAAPDGTLFVTLFNTGAVGLVADGSPVGAIDLSAYDDDGNPNPESIRIVSVDGVPKAFVALELLDNHDVDLRPKRAAKLLRIDVASRKVDGVFDLLGWNPFNTMAERDGVLYFAEPRDVDSATDTFAGIEAFDTRTNTSRILVTEKELGASVVQIAVADGCGVAIVAGPEPSVNPTSLVTFDPASGEILTRADTALLRTEGYDLQGLAFRGDALYVGDRRRANGGYPVHVLSRPAGTCSLTPTSRTLFLPQKPVALLPAEPHR